jgi:hypothetical protein
MGQLQKGDRHGPVAADELEAQEVVDLPDREALSLVTTDLVATGDNVAMPTNEAVAVNYESNYSVAVADADQVVNIEQTTVEDETNLGSDGSGQGWGRGGRR